MDPTKAYPDTLRKAFKQASKHIVISDTNEIEPATAFVMSHKGGGGGSKTGKGRGKAEEDTVRKKSTEASHHKSSKQSKEGKDGGVKPKRNPSRHCSLCSEMHWTSDCPFQKEVQEVIKRS